MIHSISRKGLKSVALAMALGVMATLSAVAQSSYGLYVEPVTVHTEGDLAGQTTYRLYMNMLNPTDYMSSCSGDSQNPLILETSSGTWYNSPANTGWNAQGVNPAFFDFFPDLAYDSYLTLGAEDATAPAAEHPSTIWGPVDASDEFTGSGNGSNVTVDDQLGGAWYIPFPGLEFADTHVAFAGEELRVLLAQFTTEGTISGQFQVQVFIEGSQTNEYRELHAYETGVGVGCTDPAATNYDATAFVDDGSCAYNTDGCTDETACNYDPNAINDDGSCEFESCQWCDDPDACNYEGEGFPWTANTDLCTYIPDGACDCDGNSLDALGVCGGACEADEDQDGICDDVDDCVGVVDECGVCNGPGAIYECGCTDIEEGACDCDGNVLDALGVCGGDCEADEDMDGICDDVDECIGYVDECGVCNGPGAVFECGCTVLLEGDCDCDGNQLDAVGVCGGDCVEDLDGDGICDTVAEGCTDPAACNYISAAMDDGSCEYPEEYYDCFGECVNDMDGDGVCDELEIPGCTDATACNYDMDATDDDGSCADLDECGECGGTGTLGCTDATACNYDMDATCDDGMCTYAETYYDCDGNCLNDTDGDGVCDELEVVGCQDETACNYDELATDEGDCEFAAEYYDCDGNCLNDADGDGICDELEVEGCTDDAACTYDELATDDDGSCAYPEDPCDDGDDTTINDAYTVDCDCVGEVDGLDEAFLSGVEVYPNPAAEVLNVVLPLGQVHQLSLIAVSGQTVVDRQVARGGTLVWDVSHVPAGAYVLQVKQEKGVIVRQVLLGTR